MSAPAGATVTLTPGLAVEDRAAAAWLTRVTLRLRREVAWCWHQRTGTADDGTGRLPPTTDACAESLDLVRFSEEKRRFFRTDVCAAYLTEELERVARVAEEDGHRGGWSWVCRALELDEAGRLVLALALATELDGALGPVCASCQNDQTRPFATAALAQRLHDDALSVVRCVDPHHPLFRYGVLQPLETAAGAVWSQPLRVHPVVAESLVRRAVQPPDGLQPAPSRRPQRFAAALAAALKWSAAEHPDRLAVVPVAGVRGTDFAAWARRATEACGRELLCLREGTSCAPPDLRALISWCWMRGFDLYLPPSAARRAAGEGVFEASAPLAVRCYVGAPDVSMLRDLDSELLERPLDVPPTTFEERRVLLDRQLERGAKELHASVDECARRFRFQERDIERVCATARATGCSETSDFFAICRSQAAVDLHGLAEPLSPRFTIGELVLPPREKRRFREIVTSMRGLTEVHYRWGTAHAWNEGGLSALFHGPSGTGKTMGAEVLASELELPLYRIDLSRVVDKYIGETEKNLRRIFDAAERSECILFFDEADALFGKRTQVRDSHDRFANIEISYLLERMERFKGLAVLATNRRDDVDEAFIRRLRFAIHFPSPGTEERDLIWRGAFPERVDADDLDFSFLAQQFQLTGGNIHSIVLNACLMAASEDLLPRKEGCVGRVEMRHAVRALEHELEKMNRPCTPDMFAPYGALLEEGDR